MQQDDRSANIHSASQRSPQNLYQTNRPGTTQNPTERISKDGEKGKSNSGRGKKDDAAFGKIGDRMKTRSGKRET
jgi:hypothetical protein